MKIKSKLLTNLACMLLFFNVMHAQDVPENITTPDVVHTQTLGELNFKDGYPSDETISKVQRYMFVQRAVTAFTDGIPITSMYAIVEGLKSIGGEANKTVAITEQLFDKNSIWLTPNTTTPYGMAEVNVKDGPVVIDLHTPVMGFIDDAFFKYVGDLGIGNPSDGGRGGKYFVVHDSYKGEIPAGYIVLKTSTYRHWLIMRLSDLDAISQFKKTFKMYRFGEETPVKYINYSGVEMNTVHANNEDFYTELNEVIQYEPVSSGDPLYRGLLATIGIQKGKIFKPEDEQHVLLKEAAAIANVHARSEAFKPTNEEMYVFGEDRKWFFPFGSTMSYQFKQDGRIFIDDRTAFHYLATGITPLMTAQFDGKGSSYIVATSDSQNKAFDGNEIYTVTLPPNPPMKQFWSFMVYDNQSRGILSTNQISGGFDSREDVVMNNDGSVTVTFSAKKPKGKSNWVQTLPDKGFFVMYRMYSPTKDWHDRKYMIGDLIKK